MPSSFVLCAHIITLQGSPTVAAADRALREFPDGAIVVDGRGRILDVGNRDQIQIPDGALIEDYRGLFLVPGFVDTHIHFPQVYLRDCYGGGSLLHWLEQWVFPGEAALADRRIAKSAAQDFVHALARAGTTTALIFGSQFTVAQEALYEELRRHGLRAVVGRTLMTHGPKAAAPLLTTLDEGLALCREEIAAIHPNSEAERDSLLRAAIIPRFALSLDARGFAKLGEFYAEQRERGVHFTTHLSENAEGPTGEVATVKKRFRVANYLDVYDGRIGRGRGRPSLLGERSTFAHAVHTTAPERKRLAKAGCSVAHCPSSQLFLGSGTMPWRKISEAGITIGAGSDVGAGDSFSIPTVLNAAWKVHMSAADRVTLSPASLLHLGTLGGAQALRLSDRIGTLEAGKDADFVLLDPRSDELLAKRLEATTGLPAAQARNQRLFALLMGGPRVHSTWVQGRRVPVTIP